MREKREIKWERKEGKKIRNKFIFGVCTVISGAAAMLGINALPVMAAEDVVEEMAVGEDVDADDDAAGKLSEDSQIGVMAENEDLGVYDFKDNKTTGTVTVTKEWNDKRTNNERPEPEIKISTKKPSKSTLGYTVTFHGNKDSGLVFDDGSDVNEVVYNSSGQIVDGVFKVPGGVAAGIISWFTDEALTNKVDVSENGAVQMTLSGDVNLWGKAKTFEIQGYNGDGSRKYNDFNNLIPETVTAIIFTDEVKPEASTIIDVDADGDGGIVAWTENNDTIMKVSTQIKGTKVQAAKNSGYMLYHQDKFTNIDFSMLDTTNVTNMDSMFDGCPSLTNLDLTPLDTSKVTSMSYMFSDCSGLTNLNLTPLDTANVTNMRYMFYDCSSLTNLDLAPLNTANVTSMDSMFSGCSGLTDLDLTPLNTAKVTNMNCMFLCCSGMTSLDLASLNTANVTDMSDMFDGCSGLTSLDLTPLDTAKVTNMDCMFLYCSGLTSLDLTQLDTTKVVSMDGMFSGCSGLTSLKTGTTFKFIGTDYCLSGTWRNTAGDTFNGNYNTANFPSNVADTYTKIS